MKNILIKTQICLIVHQNILNSLHSIKYINTDYFCWVFKPCLVQSIGCRCYMGCNLVTYFWNAITKGNIFCRHKVWQQYYRINTHNNGAIHTCTLPGCEHKLSFLAQVRPFGLVFLTTYVHHDFYEPWNYKKYESNI